MKFIIDYCADCTGVYLELEECLFFSQNWLIATTVCEPAAPEHMPLII